MLPKHTYAEALFFLHARRRLVGALLLRSISTATSAPSKPHFMVDYLISSCGFSSTEALKASKRLSHLKSTQKPESVLGFFRSNGFTDAQLRKIVSFNPTLLSYDVDKTLKPKFQSLRDWGLSQPDLTLLIASNNIILNHSIGKLLPRLTFWESLLGCRQYLIKLLKNSHNWFLNGDIESTVMPNISLLHEFGISDQRIALLLRKIPRFITRTPDVFRSDVEHVERLGVPRNSGMFLWALWALYHVSAAKFNDRKQLLTRSFGWSEEEFVTAFCRAPAILMVSQETLSKKMDFLVMQVGYKPSQVSRSPVLLMLSLEKRLIPRHCVLQVLGSTGLLCKKHNPSTYMFITDTAFIEKFVSPYKDKVPGLEENFMASCGRRKTL